MIKDYGASSGDRTLRDAIAGFARGARIEYVSEFTDKRELIRLYKSCDAFVSAHRGEGFGMKILDAMACGLPVITPLFGGPTAYCEPANYDARGLFARSDGRTASILAPCGSPTSPCGPKSTSKA